jgi:diguanylate cyclase (GGDEF)-like protein
MARGKYPRSTIRVDVEPAPAPARRVERQGVLTMLSGERPGAILPITDPELTIGRTDEAHVAFDDESLSRRHARFARIHGRYYVEDLQSTNGTFVDGRRVTEPVALEDGARIQLGVATVLRFGLSDAAMVAEARRLYEATVRDPLTGAHNRNFLDERLRAEMSYAARHGTDVSVLFVDADHFKRVNDGYGHQAGDAVLCALAALLMRTMRIEDVVARYGGEEFVVVVRGIGAVGVLAVAERIRSEVEALVVEHEGRRIPITVSIGVATHSAERNVKTAEELIAIADAALYRAKEAGRNRIVLA